MTNKGKSVKDPIKAVESMATINLFAVHLKSSLKRMIANSDELSEKQMNINTIP